MKLQTTILLAALVFGGLVTMPALAGGRGGGHGGGGGGALAGGGSAGAGRNDSARTQRPSSDTSDTTKAKPNDASVTKDDGRGPDNARREQSVDARQASFDRRIEHGARHGALTPAEVEQLNQLKQRIATLETQFTGDGRLSVAEHKQLMGSLNDASRAIFTAGHNADTTTPQYRWNENVGFKDDVARKLNDDKLGKPEARNMVADTKVALGLKTQLANDKLTDDQRAKMQAQYDEILNKYYAAREAGKDVN